MTEQTKTPATARPGGAGLSGQPTEQTDEGTTTTGQTSAGGAGSAEEGSGTASPNGAGLS
jgi:hypothetical protein